MNIPQLCPTLHSVQQFLDRCKRRGYTSKPIDVNLLLEEQDKTIFNQVRQLVNHPLYEFVPKISNTGYNLRTAHIPKLILLGIKTVQESVDL